VTSLAFESARVLRGRGRGKATRRFCLAAIIGALTLLPGAARAQIMPGGKGVDVDAQQAQFNGVMVKIVRAATQAWQEAWSRPAESNVVIERYHPEATVVQLGGPLVAGRETVRALTDSLRARVGAASLGFSDFEASEGIAYIYGPFSMEPRNGTSPTINGQHLTVLRREKNGFLIRSQLFLASAGAGALPLLPARHPSGPLTVQSMANAGTVARYRSANDLVNQLHRAWSAHDSVGIFALFSANAVLQLPGEAVAVSGARARAAVHTMFQRAGELHFVTLDYDASGRLGVLVGQYYFDVPGGAGLTGYFGLVIDWHENKWQVRSLIFT
jgi:hypothetical protein